MKETVSELATYICRLCLSNDDMLQNIFVDSSTSQIALKIMECTNIQITSADLYPPFICSNCIRKLNNAFKFKKKCENSAKFLSEHYPNPRPFLDTSKSNKDCDKTDKVDNSTDRCTQKFYIKPKKKKKRIKLQCTQPQVPEFSQEDLYSLGLKSSNLEIVKMEYESEAESSVNQPLQAVDTSTDANINQTINRKTKTNREKREQCFECGKMFESAGYLARHMKCHSKGGCLKANNLKNNEKEVQILSDNQSKQRPFVCSICRRGFSHSGQLVVHHRSHTGEKPFHCDICPKAFTQVGNLYVHKRIHSDARNFKCHLCPRDFKLPSHLGEHAKTHLTAKEHQCSICGKGFHKRSHLQIHARTHTGEKPYTCEHCGKIFSDSSNLATHIRIHTGAKPFICKKCNKGFAQKISLIRHEKKHSAEPATSEKRMNTN